MVNNPALWFVNGVVAAVVIHTTWKFFTRYWEYQSDIIKLNLRITELHRDLDEHKRENAGRGSTNFQMLYNMINTLSTTVTTRLDALEYKKTK
jgi:hypothetical protein